MNGDEPRLPIAARAATRAAQTPLAHDRESPRGFRSGALALRRSWFVRHVLVPFVVSRVTLLLVGWLALRVFQGLPGIPGAWEVKPNGQIGTIGSHLSPHSYPLVNMWTRWDGGWYQAVAKNGYKFVPGRQSNSAFFPSYPMATRIVHAVLPGNNDLSWFVSGIVVSNLALLVALSYFARLVRLDADEATASRACLYLLVFPTTFFLSAVYSESVFVSVTLAAFYHARRNQWLTAGFFGALAALSRSPGILIAVPLAVEYVAQRHFQWRKIRPDVLPLGLIPAALGGLMFYFHLRFGNMFATQDAQASWGDGWGIFRGPLYPFIQLATRPLGGHDLIDLTFALFALILSVYAAIRFRLSYGVYAVLTYLFLSSWGSFDSMPRYVLVIFPAFIALALWGRNEIFHRAYLVVASGFAVFFMMAFTLWRWVA